MRAFRSSAPDPDLAHLGTIARRESVDQGLVVQPDLMTFMAEGGLLLVVGSAARA